MSTPKCSQRKQVTCTVLDLDGNTTNDLDSDPKDDHPEEDPTSEVKDPATFCKPDDTNLAPHSHTPAVSTLALCKPADTNQTPQSRTPSVSHKPDDSVDDKIPLDIPSSSKFKRQSTSRRNFAKNIVVETYSEKKLESNVKGAHRKKQLDPQKMEKIKEAVFLLYPLEPKESFDEAWKDCKHAINESGRDLNRQM